MARRSGVRKIDFDQNNQLFQVKSIKLILQHKISINCNLIGQQT